MPLQSPTVSASNGSSASGQPDDMEAIDVIVETIIARQFHSRPGIIQRFDSEKNSVDVLVGIRAKAPVVDGQVRYYDLPLCIDVPLVAMSSPAAGMYLTFPIRQGDPCLLIFSDRMLDIFQRTGEMSMPEYADRDTASSMLRHNDITDAICIPGLITTNNAISEWNDENIELRTADRAIYAAVGPNGIECCDGQAKATLSQGQAVVNAPQGATMTDGNASITIRNGQIALNAPAGITVDAPNWWTEGGNGFFTGTIRATNLLTTSGFNANSHRHGGVYPGSSQTTPFV